MKDWTRRLWFLICMLWCLDAHCALKLILIPQLVFLPFIYPIVFAQIHDDTDTTVTADGSPQPSVAAQSSTPQQPLHEQADGRRKIDGRDTISLLELYTDCRKGRSRSIKLFFSYGDMNARIHGHHANHRDYWAHLELIFCL